MTIHDDISLMQFVIPGLTKPAPYLIRGNPVFFWIPAFAEILLRVIILQLVRFHSINRDEVLRNKGNPS
jgi:hypothetical protein